MLLVVVSTLGLIPSLLGGRLVLVRLSATGETVCGVGDGLLNLVLSGLGCVRSELLLSLCSLLVAVSSQVFVRKHTSAEVLAAVVRHCD